MDANRQLPPEEAEPEGGVSRLARIVVLACAVGLVAEIGYWSWLKLNPPEHTHGEIPAGTVFPSVPTIDFDSVLETLEPTEAGKPATLVFLLSTTCPFCQANVRTWNQIHASAGDRIRIVGLSFDPVEPTEGFVETFGVEFPLRVVVDPKRVRAELGLNQVPQTILVDDRGVVVDAWLGGLNLVLRRQVLDAMVALVPELRDRFETAASR